ncbi:Transcriptional regulatory protein RXT2 N-terminal domain-containing protein [Madurella fahalii]|uniref:Transcriptional regulatory protein RXT2 N-terminal domain-containing protein n=1 Tax=Madurella fahalii TaxID=1157608 RepID=A0ABQ0G5K5_9PEZI
MPEPAQSPAGPGPIASEKIPPLRNIAPSIFVPLQEDILKAELPRDRVERLKKILKTVDYQREGVKENLMYMFEREKKRIMMQAAETEQTLGPPKTRPGLPQDEVDEIIRNMEAPAQPGVDYNIRDMPQLDLRLPIPPDASLRDRTVVELLHIVENGLVQLNGYKKHMADIQKYYLDCLERELARIDEVGRRPEERGQGI